MILQTQIVLAKQQPIGYMNLHYSGKTAEWLFRNFYYGKQGLVPLML